MESCHKIIPAKAQAQERYLMRSFQELYALQRASLELYQGKGNMLSRKILPTVSWYDVNVEAFEGTAEYISAMSEDSLAASFGNPNAQPLTPNQTPTSTAFPSPVFETPKPYQGSLPEPGGLSPRFAEEYSVFNATPGNLRGTQGIFPDFAAATTSAASSIGHKRLLSTDSVTVEIAAAHVDQFSSNSSAPRPPADPAHRSHSSPGPYTIEPSSSSSICRSSVLTKTPTSSKRARRGGSTIPDIEPTQVISPPPTARKGERRLAPKPSMQNDPGFGHADFADPLQQDMTAFMDNVGDMFGYPMTAPANAQPNFWDPSIGMGVDLDFTTTGNDLFPQATSSHRHTGSFDWNTELQLFQDSNILPSSNQENVQPSAGLPRMPLASKPSIPNLLYTGHVNHSVPAIHATTHATTMDDPFRTTNASDAVDPGLLLSRPLGAAVDADSGRLVQSGSAEAAIVRSGKPQASDNRRSSSFRQARNNARSPDRAIASSPVRALGRSGFGRSVSEGRKKKLVRRGSLPLLAPAAVRSVSGPGLPVSKSTGRASGRASPSKVVPRLTSLASIPETSPHFRPGTSVRLFIDAHGRARTETTMGRGSALMARSRSSQDLATGRGYCSSVDGEDSDDTDDEPIIIPSRNNSFHASFALPDPRKPVGSIFHSLTRSIRTSSISERSNSNSANEGESEAETMVDEKPEPGKVGDATSELRRVVQDRQKRSLRLGTSRFLRRSLNTSNLGNFPGGIISPTSLTESSYGPDSCGVRCVCNNSRGDEGEAFLVQCESCEMWLHGQCINITRRTMPSIYICGFCANTPDAARRRARECERDNALGIGTNSSPLANKSIRSFR
ncbi:hypothetical protein E4U53_006263 [Claviceps sorghi]|nr:hypothetical protein E4U53_006263 [Claviceps sorghi]